MSGTNSREPRRRHRPLAGLAAVRVRDVLRGRSPWWVLVAVTIAVLSIASTGPLDDVDAYWHVRIGADILAHHRLTGDPAWTFGPADPTWITTQWASEVLMSGLHALLGWSGLTVLRWGAGLATLAVFGVGLHRLSGPQWARATVFALTGFAVTVDLSERPAALSFLFLAVVGMWAERTLRTGEWPRPWAPVVLTWLWANLHGSWILLPAAFGLLVLLRLLSGDGWRGLRVPGALTGVTVLAGIATPAGWSGLVAPLRVSAAATAVIGEWARTTLASPAAVAGLILLALVVVGWLRAPRQIPLIDALWAAAWTGFALLAFRNVVPALLLVAPLVARTLATGFPATPQKRSTSRLHAALTVLVLLLGLVGGGARLLLDTRLPAWTPMAAYAALQDGSPHRLLVSYNVSGQAAALTGPLIQTALDGRTDRYGATLLLNYQALMATDPGWQRTLRQLAPTDALIARNAPLHEALLDRGWRLTVSDGLMVLLHAPPPSVSAAAATKGQD